MEAFFILAICKKNGENKMAAEMMMVRPQN